MKFSTLPQVASHIINNHISFGGDGGFGYLSDTLTNLGNMNSAMMNNTSIVGATFEAWQDIPNYGLLKTYITIEKMNDGGWDVTETTSTEA